MSTTITGASGIVQNLSGYVVSGFLKTKYSDSGKLSDLGAAIVDSINGGISLNMSATGTAALPINYAFYDISAMNSGDGSVLKILAGKASIYPEVTY